MERWTHHSNNSSAVDVSCHSWLNDDILAAGNIVSIIKESKVQVVHNGDIMLTVRQSFPDLASSSECGLNCAEELSRSTTSRPLSSSMH
jgi:hypothetical protein